MNPGDLLREVVRPALKYVSPEIPWCIAAEQLVLGTAAVESGLDRLVQVIGPALGLWQIEPATHDDCWTNFLDFPAQSALREKILQLLSPLPTRLQQLKTNLLYGPVIARVKYRRAAAPLPLAGDWQALGAYWLGVYNAGGKGTIQQWTAAVQPLAGLWGTA